MSSSSNLTPPQQPQNQHQGGAHANHGDMHGNTLGNMLGNMRGQKPASITVFGILHLVFGVCGLFAIAGSAYFMVTMQIELQSLENQPAFNQSRSFNQTGFNEPKRFRDPLQAIYGQPGYLQAQIISIVVGLALTLVLLSAGALLLKSKEKGRYYSIIYGYGAMIMAGIWIIFYSVVCVMLANDPRVLPRERDTSTMILIGFVVLQLISMIYPVLTITFMTRKGVRDYLLQYK